jgi:hypothetical protein
MTEKEITSLITKNLNDGALKSNLYDQFKDEIKDKTLRKILAFKPSYEHKQKFKKMHLVLSIIWGLFILLELFGIIDLVVSFDIKTAFSLFVSIYIAFKIWNFDGRFFLPGIIWFVFTIFNAFSQLSSIHEYEFDSDYGVILIITCLYSLILCTAIYLMYHIRKNAFSYFKWFQPISNSEDEIQFKK